MDWVYLAPMSINTFIATSNPKNSPEPTLVSIPLTIRLPEKGS